MTDQRVRRKQEHLRHAIDYQWRKGNGFGDVVLIHQALTDLDWQDLDLTGRLFDQDWPVPLYINAMTGGSPETLEVNRALAFAAKRFGLPMAVGSQKAALDNPDVLDSFTVVREANPDGVIWANLGSYATPELAEQAVDMLDAQAIQIHLNGAQEMAMGEGDRDFCGSSERIAAIAARLKCPVIVKEVGFGLSMETVLRLERLPVAAYDVGGKGGTNFVRIEEERASYQSPLRYWGISTAASLLESVSISQRPVMASGGIADGLEVAQAIALGARVVGLAGVLLKAWATGGEQGIERTLARIINELKTVMMLTRCANLSELAQAPLVIKGQLAQWASSRGINVTHFGQRQVSPAQPK